MMVFFVKSKEKSYCPCCKGDLRSRDSRLRKVIRSDGTTEHIRIRRLKCSLCGKLHVELPDFIHPFKQYETETVQAALDNRANDCIAEESTIRRWKSQFNHTKQQINGFLTSLWVKEMQQHWNLLSTFSLLESIILNHEHWLAFVNRILLNSGFPAYTQFAFCLSNECDNLTST